MIRDFSILVRMVPMLIVMGTIFFLSHQPGDRIHLPALPYIDKVGHFTLYALLSYTILLIPTKTLQNSRPIIVAFVAILASLVYGVSDEIHQLYIVGRDCNIMDLLADGCGAVTVCSIWVQLRN